MNADLAEWVNQLQATLSKMEVALGAIADAVVFVDVNSQVQWCNSAFGQLIERSHSTIIGSQFRELLPLAQAGVLIEPDTYPDVEMRKGGYEVAEYEFIQGDRTLILQISGSCTGVAEDKVAVLTIRDISDRKQSQIALADSEFKFRSIVENTNDILVILTLEGVVSYISSNIINLTGYTATEVESQSFEPFVHPDDVPKLWQAFNQVASTGGKLSGIEHRVRYKDGSWRWHRCNISTFEDTPGNWLIAIVGWDITAGKQTEDGLKTSQARLNTILTHTAASIIYYRVYSNREWHLDYYSPGSALIFGYSTEELLADNQLVASHIHPEDWGVMYQDCFDQIFAEQTFEHDYRYLHPDGKLRWISAIFTSVWDQNINGWLVTSICTDITDKKHTEIALAESESKFRTIVENANDIILITNLEGVIRYISPNLETIMGYAPSELEGQSFEPTVHPDDLSKTWDAFHQLATTGERFSGLENRARHKDGSWKWFSSNLSVIRDTDGNLLFVSVARDITEHKQAEEALKASEARLNAILNSAVASIQRSRVYGNRTWDYEYFSPGSELIYGYTAEEILADNNLLTSRVHPEDWETVVLRIFDSIFAEYPGEYEYRHLHPDGNWRWICLNVTSVRDEASDCWMVTIIATDITDKKEAKIALAESEFKFRTIVENGGDVIGTVNREGIIRYISPNVENLIGFTPREMQGQSFETFIYHEDVPQLWSAFQHMKTTGDKVLGIEYRVRHKDGRCLWQLSNLSCFRDINGEFLIVGVLKDITERKQAEEALKASEAKLNAILSSAVACIQRVRVYDNRDWKYEYVSPGSELIYGYTPEKILADDYLLASRLHPQDLEAILPQIFEGVFAERPIEKEYRYLHPDGNWRWIFTTYTSVRNETEDCWLTTIVCTDITDRKQTEIALAESELKFRSIVENAGDVLCIVNLEGINHYASPNVVNLIGYTPAEIEGKAFEPLVHPDEVPKLRTAFNQVATTGDKISELEYRVIHKDGHCIWVLTNLSPFRGASGEFLIIGVVRDITERKQAEEALKASEAKLNAILSSAVACIQRVRFYAHQDWEYEYSSPGSELIYGYTPEEILADDYLIASRLHPQDLEAIRPQIFESVFAERPIEKEYRYLHPDGNWRWIFATYTSVRDETEDCWITTIVGTDITDRKQAEIALAESESKFRIIVENANDVIGIANLDGIVRYMSPNVVNWTGFTAAEMEGQSFEPFIHPDAISNLYEAFQQLATTGEKISGLEYRAKHKAGGYIWQLSNLSSFRDASGELLIIGVVRDITERKQAEEALKASEARLNAILNSAVASIQRVHVYANQDWHLQYCSPGSELIYGYTPEEILADNNLITSRIHPEDWETVVPKIFDSIFSECPSENEYRYLHPDSDWRWISLNVTSVRNEAADCWMVTVIATDITGKKRTEIALAESELKFRTIVENAGDVLCIVNLEGIIRYASPNVVNLNGYTSAELEGQSFEPFIYADDVPKLQEAFQRLTKTGERISELEYRNQHKDGRYLWQLANLSSFRDANGELLIIGVARDITERKQAEEALKASEARLNAILNSAVASIQHARVYANRTWKYEYVSPRSELIYGYTAEEILADNYLLASRIHPEDWDTVIPQIFESIFVEHPSEHEYRYLHPNGNWRWICYNITSVRDEAENDWVLTVIATDITDKKRTEIALTESEFKFRSIVENANDIICILRREGIIRYVSPNIVNITGFTPAELEGLSFEPTVHPDDVPQIQEAFNTLITPGERVSEIECRTRHKDGSWKWMSNNLSLFEDTNGELAIIGTSRDITERKQAEEALKASEARLNTILSSALAAIFQIRVDVNSVWEFEYVSEGSIHLWGFSPDELIANKIPFLERIVAKDLEAVHEATFEAIFAEGTFGGQYRYNHPDGSLRWISFQFSSTRDAATNTWVVTNVAIDITDKKQAEAVLEYRARVERLLSNISRQFIDQDVDTAINFTLEAIANFIGCDRSYIFELSDDMNQYYLIREWYAAGIPPRSDDGRVGNLTLFPWSYNQMLNHQAIAISSSEEFPPEAAAEREIFQRQSIQSMLVVPMTHSDKIVGCLGAESVRYSKTWTQDDINLLKLVGELIAIGWARHKAEESLLVAKEAAEAANRAKSTFLANMSHELRTPLNAILGFAQLMEREPTLTSRQQEFLAIINRSGEHLLNLINDVLEMSKIEAGRIVLNPELINLPRLLQTLHDIFQVRTQAKELTLQFDLASDLPQYVLTDEGKLRQVLINLLSNAVKFTETGGIILRAKAESQDNTNSIAYTLYFEVEDTGKGIAPEEIGNLFQPFVQTNSGIQAREGTGLGLTISRQFVRLMGGDIQVSSILDQGSTFRFDIQVTLADTPPVEPTLTHGRVLNLAPNQPSYRILVVDDRPENRDLIAQLLDTVGFETRMATNGQEAIQQWQEWHPHLIWMDMRMPIMDGYQATRQIRALETQGTGKVKEYKQPTIIIALTASAFEEQREHILAAGCDDFVRKPFREQVIFDKMAQYLGVGYIYAQDSQIKDTKISTSGGDETILTADDLAVMPTEWVAELHQAAIEVDSDQIIQLIEQIPECHVVLVEGLTHWVDNFCFDEIIELIDSIN